MPARPCARLRRRSADQARQEAGQRLARAGRRDQQGRAARGRLVQQGQLVRRGCQPRASNQAREGWRQQQAAGSAWRTASLRGLPQQTALAGLAAGRMHSWHRAQAVVRDGAYANAQIRRRCARRQQGATSWTDASSSATASRARSSGWCCCRSWSASCSRRSASIPATSSSACSMLITRIYDLGFDTFHWAFTVFPARRRGRVPDLVRGAPASAAPRDPKPPPSRTDSRRFGTSFRSAQRVRKTGWCRAALAAQPCARPPAVGDRGRACGARRRRRGRA